MYYDKFLKKSKRRMRYKKRSNYLKLRGIYKRCLQSWKSLNDPDCFRSLQLYCSKLIKRPVVLKLNIQRLGLLYGHRKRHSLPKKVLVDLYRREGEMFEFKQNSYFTYEKTKVESKGSDRYHYPPEKSQASTFNDLLRSKSYKPVLEKNRRKHKVSGEKYYNIKGSGDVIDHSCSESDGTEVCDCNENNKCGVNTIGHNSNRVIGSRTDGRFVAGDKLSGKNVTPSCELNKSRRQDSVRRRSSTVQVHNGDLESESRRIRNGCDKNNNRINDVTKNGDVIERRRFELIKYFREKHQSQFSSPGTSYDGSDTTLSTKNNVGDSDINLASLDYEDFTDCKKGNYSSSEQVKPNDKQNAKNKAFIGGHEQTDGMTNNFNSYFFPGVRFKGCDKSCAKQCVESRSLRFPPYQTSRNPSSTPIQDKLNTACGDSIPTRCGDGITKGVRCKVNNGERGKDKVDHTTVIEDADDEDDEYEDIDEDDDYEELDDNHHKDNSTDGRLDPKSFIVNKVGSSMKCENSCTIRPPSPAVLYPGEENCPRDRVCKMSVEMAFRPIICPITNCNRMVAPGGLLKHLNREHSSISTIFFDLDEFYTISFFLEDIVHQIFGCLCAFNIPLNVCYKNFCHGNNGEAKLVPFVLMGTRLRTVSLTTEEFRAGRERRDGRSIPFREGAGAGDALNHHEFLILWLCSVQSDPLIHYTLEATRNSYRTRSCIFTGSVAPLSALKQDPGKLFMSGNCLVMSCVYAAKIAMNNGHIDINVRIHH